MKLSEVKDALKTMDKLKFQLPDSTFVPEHFHITEVGLTDKHFIDCGGTERREKTISFQLWEAADYDHRLAPQKLLKIIDISEKVIGLGDFEVEVEYQAQTIGKYALERNGDTFLLTSKFTNCLASDSCGIPADKLKVSLADLGKSKTACCTPGGGCC